MLRRLREGGIASALRHKHFRRYAGGDLVSLIGNWVQRVAVGWLTWELTESGTWLGIVAVAELAPSILFAPLGGVFADKIDRLRIAIFTQSVLMGQAAALAALTLADAVDIWSLVALTAARGCLNAFSHPARQAMVPSLVPRGDLATAIALNSVLFNTARFIGPAFAGAIIAGWGIGHAFLFNTATFLVFLLTLVRLELPFAETFVRKPQSLTAQVGEVARYVAGHAGIGPLLVLMLATAILARPVGDLLPGFSGAVFEAGAAGLAWMTSCMGLGSIVGGFAIAQRGRIEGLTNVAVAHTLFAAVTLIAFAFAPRFWIGLAMLTVASGSMSITGISCQTLIQNAVAGALRGRVISIYGVIFRAAPALGALGIGALSEFLGWHWPLAGSAGLCIAVWLWGRRRTRSMAAALEASR